MDQAVSKYYKNDGKAMDEKVKEMTKNFKKSLNMSVSQMSQSNHYGKTPIGSKKSIIQNEVFQN